MKRIHKYLDIRFEKHKKEWDTVIAICGDVGVGKSNLLLWFIEYWNTILYGEVKSSDVKHAGLTKELFIKDLADAKPLELTGFDEAGELSSRAALTKFNKDLMIAYQVIRADRIFTVLVLPDLWYLDSYFRNTRVKHLFYVYKRGRVACWGKNRLRKLMAINENRYIKNYWASKPNFYDTYPIYKGVMAEEYLKLKKQKTSEARKKLAKVTAEDKPNTNIKKEVFLHAYEQTGDRELSTQIAKVTSRSAYTYLKSLKGEKGKEVYT